MAQQHFPSEEAIGKRIHLTFAGGTDFSMEEGHPREVVGVVGNVRQWGLRWDPEPAVYISFHQHIWDYPNGAYEPHVSKQLIIRSASGQLPLASAVREILMDLDKDQAVDNIQSMERHLSDSIGFWYFWVRLLGIFAGLAVVLVVVGIYGVMAYSVRQRTHEVGVRMALGASRSDVLRLVIWQGFKLTAIGLLIGIGTSYWLTKFISRYLYGVSPTDPLTLGLVCAVVIAVAMTACYIPGRWATKVNPVVALRYE
jgi:putative ABC transport system permease protein